MKKSLRFLVLSGMTAWILLLVPGCGGSTNGEQQAEIIYEKAEKLRSDGRIIDALEEFARLTAFKESAVFQKAEAALFEEGISIETPLQSWTIKRMVEVQNTLIRKGMQQHPDGDITVAYEATDAWGRVIMVQYSSGSKYSFVVISAGKDRRFDTDDDLKIFNRRGKRPARPTSKTGISLNTIEQRRWNKTETSGKTRSKEQVVPLHDLMNN